MLPVGLRILRVVYSVPEGMIATVGEVAQVADTTPGAVRQLATRGYLAKHGRDVHLTPRGRRVVMADGAEARRCRCGRRFVVELFGCGAKQQYCGRKCRNEASERRVCRAA